MLVPAFAFLEKGKRKRMQIVDVRQISPDTKVFRLSFGSSRRRLGLPIGKHLTIHAPNPVECLASGSWNGKPDVDKGKAEISRTYTPITSDATRGYTELMIKCYRPGTVRMPDGSEMIWEDGGKMSRFLDAKLPGDYLDVSGPVGVHEYIGLGCFKVPGRVLETKHICMMAGGVGVTPILQIVQAALRNPKDKTTLTLLYANKTYNDILAREMLLQIERDSNGRFKVHYTLDFPPPEWQGRRGFITAEMIQDVFVPPSESPLVVMCGPPPMIDFACKKNLEKLGYPKSSWIAL